MVPALRKKLVVVTLAYWFLLLYMVAALVWWFISLETQNRQMTDFKTSQLRIKYNHITSSVDYKQELEKIEEDAKRNTTKFIGEGTTFLALILLGAVFVYRAVRRQFRFQLQQQNFMMAVTHELKTPIAVARLNLETLQKFELDPSRREKLLRTTLQETNRLNTLASNILVSAQLEGERYNISREELDFSELVKNCIQGFRSRYPERPFETNVHDELDLPGDAFLLEMMVNNLLENAHKYSPPGEPIVCSLEAKDHHILLQVKDSGPGIPEAEKKKIFQKFYRLGNESTRTSQGTGLGLYLCYKIARDHRASIAVSDHSPTGSIFTVDFKVITRHEP